MSDEIDDDALVLQFLPRTNPDHPALPVTEKRRGYLDQCKHLMKEVDENARTVTCTSCGAVLDPIDVVLEWARYGGRLDSRITEIRAEHERVRRLAEARAKAKENDVPNVLARTKKGDELRVWVYSEKGAPGTSRYQGEVLGITATRVTLKTGMYSHGQFFQRELITEARILRKAK